MLRMGALMLSEAANYCEKKGNAGVELECKISDEIVKKLTYGKILDFIIKPTIHETIVSGNRIFQWAQNCRIEVREAALKPLPSYLTRKHLMGREVEEFSLGGNTTQNKPKSLSQVPQTAATATAATPASQEITSIKIETIANIIEKLSSKGSEGSIKIAWRGSSATINYRDESLQCDFRQKKLTYKDNFAGQTEIIEIRPEQSETQATESQNMIKILKKACTEILKQNLSEVVQKIEGRQSRI